MVPLSMNERQSGTTQNEKCTRFGQGRSSFLYGYSYYTIAIIDFLEYIHSLYQLTKYRVMSIKVGLRSIRNEKLAAIGIWASIGH